jgi:hypothetical protein
MLLVVTDEINQNGNYPHFRIDEKKKIANYTTSGVKHYFL